MLGARFDILINLFKFRSIWERESLGSDAIFSRHFAD